MTKNVFFPRYAKIGTVETLTVYSIGDKKYNVYLITIDDENKFVHDEREKGKLEFITIEDAKKSMESIDNQIRELNNQINKLRRAKEQNQYIINVLKNNVSSNGVKPSDSEKKSFTNEAKPFNLGTNPSDNGIKFSGQPNFQNKKSCNEEQSTEQFIISTPLGLVADVDDEGITFTIDISEAKTFDNKLKGIRFAKETFGNQLPFRVEPIAYNRECGNYKCHCSNERDLFSLLNQVFSEGHPNKENIEILKELFPSAEIKGFAIDENGHVTEL